MQYGLLKLLRCPITKSDLRFVLISEFEKSYSGEQVREIREGLLFSETGFVSVIDVGCGHGIMTTKIAQLSDLAVGVELSEAIENVYLRNEVKNAWYVQGYLHKKYTSIQITTVNQFGFLIVGNKRVI